MLKARAGDGACNFSAAFSIFKWSNWCRDGIHKQSWQAAVSPRKSPYYLEVADGMAKAVWKEEWEEWEVTEGFFVSKGFFGFDTILRNTLVSFARKMGGKNNNNTPRETVNILDIYHESKENPWGCPSRCWARTWAERQHPSLQQKTTATATGLREQHPPISLHMSLRAAWTAS